MVYKSKTQVWKKILRNAIVLGAISGVSQMIATQDFSWRGLMAGVLAAALVALIEIKHAYNIVPTPKFKGRMNGSFFLA